MIENWLNGVVGRKHFRVKHHFQRERERERERERVRERERKRERERGLIVYLNPHTSIEYLFHVRKLTGVAM